MFDNDAVKVEDISVPLAQIPSKIAFFGAPETEAATLQRYRRVLANKEENLKSIKAALFVHALGAALNGTNYQDIAIFRQMFESGKPHQSQAQSMLENILKDSRSFEKDSLLQNAERAHRFIMKMGTKSEKQLSQLFVDEVKGMVASAENEYNEMLDYCHAAQIGKV